MEGHADNAAEADAAATLCVSCAMCCTGVLHSSAKAQPSELPRLKAAGMTVEQVGERLQFRLPCHHNVDGECTIYANRFTTCRTFRCALLKRLDAGEVSLAEAMADVATAKGMLARIEAQDPQSAIEIKRITLRSSGRPASDATPAAQRLWLDSLALDLFLDRKFRNKPLSYP